MHMQVVSFAAVQLCGVAGLLGLLVILPPASGAMALHPITSNRTHGVAALAIEAGAVPIGRTPGGALIVRGDRNRLMAALVPHAIIPVATPDRLCSTPAERPA